MQQLSGTLSGRIRAGLVVDMMPETSTSKYFVQKSLEKNSCEKKRTILEFEMIFILRKCRQAQIPNLESELCFASQKLKNSQPQFPRIIHPIPSPISACMRCGEIESHHHLTIYHHHLTIYRYVCHLQLSQHIYYKVKTQEWDVSQFLKNNRCLYAQPHILTYFS